MPLGRLNPISLLQPVSNSASVAHQLVLLGISTLLLRMKELSAGRGGILLLCKLMPPEKHHL